MNANILYQFNEKYAPYAGVSITSLFENNRHIENMNVYILADKISPLSKVRLMETGSKYGRNMVFLDTRELINLMKSLEIPTYRGSYAANLKLFIPMVTGDNIERLLYIDSDTVIPGDIAPLFALDMKGKALGMSLDSLGVKHKELIGLSPEDDYYNTGVMLFDMTRWKERMCTERVIEHAKNVRAHYMSPDQDLVNVVLHDDIYRMEAKYNLQPIHIVYNYKQFDKFFGQKDYYTAEEITEALDEPVIIHFFRFLGQFPWDKDSIHPDKELFDNYMKMSLWSDYDKVEGDHNGMVFKIERWLYQNMPEWVFMTLFKINYDRFIRRSEKASKENKNNKDM